MKICGETEMSVKKRSIKLVLPFALLLSCGVVEKLANRAPSIERVSAESFTVLVGDTVLVWVVATDPDEDELTASWTSNGGSFIGNQGDTVRWIAPRSENSYELFVTVKDANGGEAEGSITLTVSSLSKPQVRITDPRNGEAIVAIGSTEIQVDASPADFIARVEFYIDDKLLGSDSTTPYRFSWPLDGLYGWKEIKAVAYRAHPANTYAADSIKVAIQGVIPIP